LSSKKSEENGLQKRLRMGGKIVSTDQLAGTKRLLAASALNNQKNTQGTFYSKSAEEFTGEKMRRMAVLSFARVPPKKAYIETRQISPNPTGCTLERKRGTEGGNLGRGGQVKLHVIERAT